MEAVSLQQIIMDVNKLTNRLKDDETASDKLLMESQCTHNHVSAIKEYSEDAELLNEAADQQPHKELREKLKKEIDHLKILQDENRALRDALDDHQNALEFVMSKYRKHVSQLLQQTHYDITSIYNTKYSQIIMDQCKEIDRMRDLIREVVDIDEQSTIKDYEVMCRLVTENKGLRELLGIYNKFGKQQPHNYDDTVIGKKVEPIDTESVEEVDEAGNKTEETPAEL